MSFQRKYNATPFDPTNPTDRIAERSRKLLVKAFAEAGRKIKPGEADDLQAMLAGFLVGQICIIAAHMESSDENHASLRAGIIELVPWAVDMMRSIDDLPPLSDGN
ncbi:MAG: hypothetical protein AAFN94_00680 [Pseudomonadota bacterium]